MSVGFYACNMQKHSISQEAPGYQDVINNLNTSMIKGIKQTNKIVYTSHPLCTQCKSVVGCGPLSTASDLQSVRIATILEVANHSGRGKNISSN